MLGWERLKAGTITISNIFTSWERVEDVRSGPRKTSRVWWWQQCFDRLYCCRQHFRVGRVWNWWRLEARYTGQGILEGWRRHAARCFHRSRNEGWSQLRHWFILQAEEYFIARTDIDYPFAGRRSYRLCRHGRRYCYRSPTENTEAGDRDQGPTFAELYMSCLMPLNN
jgi:hypothetical protein